MTNWKISSESSIVSQYVECYWLLEKTQEDRGPEHHKLNPDPSAHLIIADASQPYLYEHESHSDSGTGCHLILPHCKTISIDHSRPFLIIGVKFRVGALYTLKMPSREPMLDRVVSFGLGTLIQLPDFDESALLDQAPDNPESCRDALDKLLEPAFLALQDDKYSEVVQKAQNFIVDSYYKQHEGNDDEDHQNGTKRYRTDAGRLSQQFDFANG